MSQESSERERLEKAFREAEASMRLEGFTFSADFHALKERVLAGEIDFDQAVAELKRRWAAQAAGCWIWPAPRRKSKTCLP